jgi:hypothetical protein
MSSNLIYLFGFLGCCVVIFLCLGLPSILCGIGKHIPDWLDFIMVIGVIFCFIAVAFFICMLAPEQPSLKEPVIPCLAGHNFQGENIELYIYKDNLNFESEFIKTNEYKNIDIPECKHHFKSN